MKIKFFAIKHWQMYILLAPMLLFTSCNKDSNEVGNDSLGVIQVSISDIIFEEGHSSMAKLSSINPASDNTSQEMMVRFDENIFLKGVLIEENTFNNKEQNQKNKSAATVSQNVKPGVRYRVFVFEESGGYKAHRDYIHGQESNTAPLFLDGNKTYTFIAYSVNSSLEIDLPNVENVYSLSTATIKLDGEKDFMYFKKSLKVSGSDPNFLNIIFKHKLSQVTLTIDAKALPSKIRAIESRFSPTYVDVIFGLQNGEMLFNNTNNNAQTIVKFPTISGGVGVDIITSSPTIIHTSEAKSINYVINTLTIGTTSKYNISFPNLRILPGHKYNLKLTFTPPKDIETEHEGEEVVVINDQIWMRRNLGVPNSVNPHIGSINLHGEFYKWGRKIPVANATRIYDNTIYSYPPQNTFDRMGQPRGTQDPCPSGFRIPTDSDFKKLYDSTTQTVFGRRSGNNNAYMYFESKDNPNVKMTVPYTGLRTNGDLILLLNGESIALWVSNVKDYMGASLNYFGYVTGVVPNTSAQHNAAMPIRCIAIR